MRERWFGAHGFRVHEIAVEGEDVAVGGGGRVAVGGSEYEALVVDGVGDLARIRAAFDEGLPVVVRSATAEQVRAALARPEVACALVPAAARELRDLDLTGLTYE
jgi:hypothetical protein